MNKTALKTQLTRHEGLRPHVYRDTKGLETIGVGRNISASGPGLRPAEIDFLLDNDINECEKEARKYYWYSSLDDTRQNVILNLIFNMGANTFSTFKKFHTACSVRNWVVAVRELDDSKWQEQVDPVLGDGKGRADELLSQLLTGVLK